MEKYPQKIIKNGKNLIPQKFGIKTE